MSEEKINEQMEAFCEMLDSDDFDFVDWVNAAFLRKSFMWDVASWPFFRIFIGQHYENEIMKMALVWSEALDEEIEEWAKYCEKHGLLLDKLQLFKHFFDKETLVKMGKEFRTRFNKMLEELPE